MNTKEAKAKIADMLSAGSKKGDVLSTLSGQGIKDRVLARLIASRPDPERCARNKWHIRILIAIAVFQLILSVGLAVAFGGEGSPGAAIVFAAIAVPLALLFIWGFATNRVGAYHAFIVLSVIQLPKQFLKLQSEPDGTLIGLAIGVALLAYVWFVRNRLFPDFAFLSPRKVAGQYVFVDRA